MIGQDIGRIRKTVYTFERGGARMHCHITTKRPLIARRVISGQMMPGMSFAVFAQLFLLNASLTMLPAMKAMLAGRSARRRMRYGYHCVPNGT